MTPIKASTPKASEEASKENKKVAENADNVNNAKGPPSAIEFEPPLACVRRILKNSLPSSTNVGKDASAAFARASGIFIIYLTACANDFARENRRQTITANDVLAAIKELEFDEFTPELTSFLERYREAEKTKRAAKAKAKEDATMDDAMDGDDDEDDGDEHKVDVTPQSIKSKGDETADNSLVGANEGDQTEDEDRDGEGDEDDEVDDMEE